MTLFTVCLIKGVCSIEVLLTVIMGREIWDFVYCLLNKGCLLNRGTFTINMRRENWEFVYCLLNKGCLLNRGAFYSKHGKRNLGLGLLCA